MTSSEKPHIIRDLELDFPNPDRQSDEERDDRVDKLNAMFHDWEMADWVSSIGHAMLELKSDKDRDLFKERLRLILCDAIQGDLRLTTLSNLSNLHRDIMDVRYAVRTTTSTYAPSAMSMAPTLPPSAQKKGVMSGIRKRFLGSLRRLRHSHNR